MAVKSQAQALSLEGTVETCKYLSARLGLKLVLQGELPASGTSWAHSARMEVAVLGALSGCRTEPGYGGYTTGLFIPSKSQMKISQQTQRPVFMPLSLQLFSHGILSSTMLRALG